MLTDIYAKYRVTVPPGISGDWEVKRFEVKRDLQSLRMERDGRGTPEGWYTGLYHKGEGVVMSDTNAEIRDFLGYIRQFEGNVLVTGLGLGCVVQALLRNEKVNRVYVVEHSQDVINIVAHHYYSYVGSKLDIMRGDAFTFVPPKGTRFDYAWHDIWTAPSTDDLVDMGRLRRHYARHMKASQRQYCWSEDTLKQYKKRGW